MHLMYPRFHLVKILYNLFRYAILLKKILLCTWNSLNYIIVVYIFLVSYDIYLVSWIIFNKFTTFLSYSQNIIQTPLWHSKKWLSCKITRELHNIIYWLSILSFLVSYAIYLVSYDRYLASFKIYFMTNMI